MYEYVKMIIQVLQNPAADTIILLLSAIAILFEKKQLTIQTRSLVYQEIARQMQSIDYLFIKEPFLRKCFYSDCDINTLNDEEILRVLSTAELIVDFADNVLYQKKFIKGYPWHTWDQYFCAILQSEPIKFYLANRENWYPKHILEYITKCKFNNGQA